MSTISTRRTKEEKELFLVKEFLESEEIDYTDAVNRPSPEPDIRVDCLIDGKLQRIGIELTEFQCDNNSKGSPKRQMASEWNEIVQIINREYVLQHPILSQFMVHPYLDERIIPRKTDRSRIVGELVEFLVPRLEKIAKLNVIEQFWRVRHDRQPSDFEGFPLIRRHFKHFAIWRERNHPVESIFWYCADAGNIGLSSDVLEKRIVAKTERSYDTSEVDEMWLLIVASGETAADRAGDLVGRNTEILTSPYLRTLAEATSFDRIIFWERVAEWGFDILDRTSSRRSQH